jgi:hypothetical protein
VRLHHPVARFRAQITLTVTLLLFGALPRVGRCQISTAQANLFRTGIENRIEALTILGGDFGLSGGSFRYGDQLGQFNADVKSDVTKGGGVGEVGDPRPLGDLGIGWQPILQGNMGYLHSRILPRAGSIAGGARFWLSDRFSVAPTLMGLYGDTSNNYTARSAFALANRGRATRLGLIDWRTDTWTVRPALDLQYLIRWDRLLVTLSADPTYFHTRGFASSNANVNVNGDSGSLDDKIDLDVPLGMKLLGHELHTGGYLSRTELFGDLQRGLDVQHINEIHGRIVLDVLDQYWKFKWIGLGASYIWGPNISGWTVGADVAFHF